MKTIHTIFILVNRSEIRSDIQEVIKSENEFQRSVYPPDILKLVKNNANCDMFFRRSGRDNSIPKDKMKYEIFTLKSLSIIPHLYLVLHRVHHMILMIGIKKLLYVINSNVLLL